MPPPIEGVLSSSAGLTRSIDEIGVALPPIEPVIEDQFEAGVTTGVGPFELALTSYYRDTANPVHTTIWPDSRIYSYASFDRGRAYGLEAKLEMPAARAGMIGFLNYALGRVDFKNPVTGGFVTEAGHIVDNSWFRAPMDQTHTLTGGTTYSHASSGLWVSGAIEYGSGTPMGHGVAAHDHAAGTAPHAHAAGGPVARVPEHVTGGVAAGVNLWRAPARRPRLALQVDLENITNNVFVIAREGEFSPAQYSNPRLLSVTVKFSY